MSLYGWPGGMDQQVWGAQEVEGSVCVGTSLRFGGFD